MFKLLDLLKGSFSPPDQKQGALADPWLALAPSIDTTSGTSIGPATAMRVPSVASAVALLSGATASLPAKVYVDQAGARTADTRHPAHKLIHDQANPWTSAAALREQLTVDALLHDQGGFAFVNRVQGKPVELIRLDPTSMAIETDGTTGEPRFVSNAGVTKTIYSFRDVLHVRAPSGVAPIRLAKEAIGLALVLEQHAARLFAKGARPSGILRFEKVLGEDALKRIASGWHAAHAGGNSGRTAILEEGGQFQALSFSSVDAQFAEMRAFQIVEIARAFRVPPHMIFDLGRATWSNSEQMRQDFLTFSLMPWLRIWQDAYSRVLIDQDDRDTFTIEFVVDALLRPDTQTRAGAYQVFRSAGIMTANEIRALENLAPLPDGNSLANPYTGGAPTGEAA